LWVYGGPTRTATCAAAIGKNRRGVRRDDPSGKKSRHILRRNDMKKKLFFIGLLLAGAAYAYCKWREYWHDDCYWGE
jgi:hypothetical protein